MTSPHTAAPSARDRVRSVLAGNHALYAPSVVDQATALLEELLAVADRYGAGPRSTAAGRLVTAAAEAAPDHHRRPVPERTAEQLGELSRALSHECTRLGLTPAPACGGGVAVAVEPVQSGPAWGTSATGLAVRIYTDAGWDLTINQVRTPVVAIYAPATTAGAREVAQILADIIHGRTRDPFARDQH